MLTSLLSASSAPNLIMATFDRHHGVSAVPFSSLNCSFGVGDKPDHVERNRQTIKDRLPIRQLVSARQVHGDQIYRVEETADVDREIDGVDALITNIRGVGLMIQHADCQAILLHDPAHSAIGAIHCGWRGNVIDIIEKTVRAMHASFNSRPEDMRAAIGPSLGPCCAQFINYQQELPSSFREYQTASGYFDFWQISRAQLTTAGLPPAQITTAAICTSCTADFFSYRRAKRRGNGITGRNCSIIALTTP